MGSGLGENGLAVAGGVAVDVGNGLLHAVHHPDGQDIIQKFRVEVVIPGGDSPAQHLHGLGVQPELHRGLAGLPAADHQAVPQLGQKVGGDVPMDQADFGGVAHRGAAGFGVFHHRQGLLQVGVAIYVDVTDSGAGLNAGDLGLVDTGLDQRGAAPGNEQINIAHGLHEFIGAGPGGVGDQTDQGSGQVMLCQSFVQGGHDGGVGVNGLLPAPQDADASRLEGEAGGI